LSFRTVAFLSTGLFDASCTRMQRNSVARNLMRGIRAAIQEFQETIEESNTLLA
jgi:hypothetical protein